MFPHKYTYTPCFSELVCYIAERSSKQSPQRHSALLPASNSKSCPWSGEVGGQLWFGEAGQARSCIRLLVWNKKKKKRKSVLHTEENIVVPVPHLPVCAVSRALFSHKALCSFVGLNEICALQIESGNSHLTGTQKGERLSASFTASKSWQCAVIFCQRVNNHCIKKCKCRKTSKNLPAFDISFDTHTRRVATSMTFSVCNTDVHYFVLQASRFHWRSTQW